MGALSGGGGDKGGCAGEVVFGIERLDGRADCESKGAERARGDKGAKGRGSGGRRGGGTFG